MMTYNDNIYYVYTHTTKDGLVFYVGEGKDGRAKCVNKRSKEWKNIVSNNPDYIITIIKDNLTKEEAEKLEQKLIIKYGRSINNTGSLVNKSTGFGNTDVKYDLNYKSIPLYQLNYKGIIVKEFKNAIEVKDLLGFDNSAITKACNGIYKQVFGFQWVYKKDYTKAENHLYKDYNFPPIVAMVKKDNKFFIVNAFNTIKEATKSGFNRDCINKCLKGQRDVHQGYYWKYLKNITKSNQEKIILKFNLYNEITY